MLAEVAVFQEQSAICVPLPEPSSYPMMPWWGLQKELKVVKDPKCWAVVLTWNFDWVWAGISDIQATYFEGKVAVGMNDCGNFWPCDRACFILFCPNSGKSTWTRWSLQIQRCLRIYDKKCSHLMRSIRDKAFFTYKPFLHSGIRRCWMILRHCICGSLMTSSPLPCNKNDRKPMHLMAQTPCVCEPCCYYSMFFDLSGDWSRSQTHLFNTPTLKHKNLQLASLPLSLYFFPSPKNL